MPCSECRQQFSELLQKLQQTQGELSYLKIESQLKQQACQRHIALLEQTVSSLRDQLSKERQTKHKEASKKVQDDCKRMSERHELQVQSYRNEQRRLQQLASQLQDKLTKQANVHKAIIEQYRNRITKLQEQLFKPLEMGSEAKAHKKEPILCTGSAQDIREASLLQLYEQCMRT